MVDPSETSGPPPEGAAIPKDPDGFIPVSPVRKKRLEHAAKVVTPASEKERLFTLSHTFLSDGNEQMTFNLYDVHKAFVIKMMEVVDGSAHLQPTARRNPQDPRPVSVPILSATAFPDTDKKHRLFFRRQETTDTEKKTTTIRIYHAVMMKEEVEALKLKMMEFLQENKLWMGGGDLNSTNTAVIGWFPHVHPYISYRPTIEAKINTSVSEHPRRDALIAKHIPSDEEQTLPYLYVHSRTMNMGQGTGRVTTTAMTVTCRVDRCNLMKELLSDMDDEDLGYDFLPSGFLQLHGVEAYKKWMIINNDYQNDVLAIAVLGFFDDLLNREVAVDGDTSTIPVSQFLVSDTSILSLERTQTSDKDGRWLFLVKKTAYQQARLIIEEFCTETFPTLYSDDVMEQHDAKVEYSKQHGGLPRITEGTPVGGSVSIRSSIMFEKLKATEASQGNKTPDSKISWAQRTAPRLIFEKNSNFPLLSKTPPKSTLVAASPTTTATDTQSATGSVTSLSTAAAGQMSTQMSQSQDASTIVSEMRSIFSEQSKNFERILERQDRMAQEQSDKNMAFMEKMFTSIVAVCKPTPLPAQPYYQHPYYAPQAYGPPHQYHPGPPMQQPPLPFSPPADTTDLYSGLTDAALQHLDLASVSSDKPPKEKKSSWADYSRAYKIRLPSVTFKNKTDVRTYSTVTPASVTGQDEDDENFPNDTDSPPRKASPSVQASPPNKTSLKKSIGSPSFSGGTSLSKRPRSPGSTPEKSPRPTSSEEDMTDLEPTELFPDSKDATSICDESL